ncbi:MAG TPA: ATP-binding protein, partial [Polyangiaceae bacterium]|nr:ATP-binding protein [Polyangiaceae bacterium]
IVRGAARRLARADGSSFVLRDGDQSYYVDEDAIEPLWKGRRFPLSSCVSGWSMCERKAAVIADVYADPRVPVDAYRPTFVRSMVMVPIRKADPIGAIGIYWREPRAASDWEVRLLQALADSTAVAMENIRVYSELEAQVEQRTAQLEAANRELSAFADSVSHDLKAPLRRIQAYSNALSDDCAAVLDATALEYLRLVSSSAAGMTQMVDALLQLSRWGQAAVRRSDVDLTPIAQAIVEELRLEDPERRVEVALEPGVRAHADPELARIVLANLLRNAWKFTAGKPGSRIEFGCQRPRQRPSLAAEPPIYFVRDNGAGFRMEYADQLFLPFRRLHGQHEFPGTGIGLATVQRIVHRHDGRVWADGAEGQGAAFFWTFAPTGAR